MIHLLAFLLAFLVGSAAIAQPVPTVAVPPTRVDGTIITAAIYNNDVGNIYLYLDNQIAPILNVLTTRGDMYVFDGTTGLQRLPIGTQGQALIADSGQALGMRWASLMTTAPFSNTGDIITYNGTSTVALPVGPDGSSLMSDSTQPDGIAWETPESAIPVGTVVAWSPAAAGTNVIPAGWGLCDGGTHGSTNTPNLIGMFIVGTRPPGSTAAFNTAGYGVEPSDANGTGTKTHVHAIPTTNATTGPTAGMYLKNTGTGTPLVQVATATHTHTFTYGGFNTAATSSEPADYALVYIMKINPGGGLG